MENRLKIELGALCDPIAKQLKKQGLPFDEKEVERFEKARDSITFLYFGKYISASQTHKLYQLLVNKISKHIQKEIEL